MSPSSEPAPAPPAESMVRSVTIPVDLHARPAGLLARTAAGFTAAVTVCAGDRSASARSVLEVMALGATAGAEVTLQAAGPDAETAVTALAALLTAVEA